MRFLAFVPFSSFLLVAVACGGSDSDPLERGQTPPPSASSSSSSGGAGREGEETEVVPTLPPPSGAASHCVDATTELCTRASTCGAVTLFYAGAAEEHETLADCLNFYRYYVCTDAARSAAYDAECQTGATTAACTTKDGKPGLAFPATCAP